MDDPGKCGKPGYYSHKNRHYLTLLRVSFVYAALVDYTENDTTKDSWCCRIQQEMCPHFEDHFCTSRLMSNFHKNGVYALLATATQLAYKTQVNVVEWTRSCTNITRYISLLVESPTLGVIFGAYIRLEGIYYDLYRPAGTPRRALSLRK